MSASTRGEGAGSAERSPGGRAGRRRRRVVPAVLAVLVAGCGDAGEEPVDQVPVAPPEPAVVDRVVEGVWSPDGLRLAVTWDRGAGARLYGVLAGTDSTPPEAGRGLPLTRGRGAWATWSPDGLWIAYEAGGDLHRMRPDGTGAEPLLGGAGAASHPAWSPDGFRIAFVLAGDGVEAGGGPGSGEPTLRIMASDGGEPRALPVAVRGRWRAPVWHPSGQTLVAEMEAGAGAALYRVDPGSGAAQRITTGGSPAFSPGGDTLWYSRGDSVFRRPWGEGGPGGEEMVVAPGRAPRPAPDGVRLAFVREGADGHAGLHLLDLRTGAVQRITLGPPEEPVGGRPGPDGRGRPPGGGP